MSGARPAGTDDADARDILWFIDHGETPRAARALALAEAAARRAGYTVRWALTWACQVLPADPEGLIESETGICLDAHPSADPRARDVERRLVGAAGLDRPGSPGHDCYYVTWCRQTTCRVYARDGTLLDECSDFTLRPDDADRARVLTAFVLTDMDDPC